MDDIVLGEQGATMVVELLDKTNSPARDIWVTLLADPSGLTADARGSWLHHRAFHQRAVTSDLGNVRFSRIPPGLVIAQVKTSSRIV